MRFPTPRQAHIRNEDPSRIKPYIRMPFVPAWVARSLYLAFTDDYAVGPPSFRHRPGYPLYHNLEPGTGIAAPHSPRLRVFTFIGLEFVFLTFLGYELVVFHTAMIFLALGLALVNLVVIWVAYLSWASNVLVVTPNAIYRYSGIYAAMPQSIQGNDIKEVKESYRRPRKPWKALGYGRVSILFGGKHEGTVWELRGIGNAEGLASLIRGLQRSEEEANKEGTELLREIRDLLIDLRGFAIAAWNQHDQKVTAQPAPTPTPTGSTPALVPTAMSDEEGTSHSDTTESGPPTISYELNEGLGTYIHPGPGPGPTPDPDEPPDHDEPPYLDELHEPDEGHMPTFNGPPDPLNEDEPDPPDDQDEGPVTALFDRPYPQHGNFAEHPAYRGSDR